MSNIEFKELNENTEGIYCIYRQVHKWDKNHTWCVGMDDDESLMFLFNKIIGLYLNNELIGYGSITNYPTNMRSYVTLSCIIHPKYRNMGYGTLLLHKLLDVSIKSYDATYARVEILKSNIASITIVENGDFDFVNFNDKSIVFEKKLRKIIEHK